MKRRCLVLGLLIVHQGVVHLAFASGSTAGGGGGASMPAALPEALRNAPPNTWVRIGDTGGRFFPVLWYGAATNRFLLGLGSSRDPSADVEELDLADGAWKKTPTSLTGSAKTVGGWAFFQYAGVPGMNDLFVYMGNRTYRFDLSSHQWTDLNAAPSPADHDGCYFRGVRQESEKPNVLWSSMCWDPVNREVLLNGGRTAEPGGAPGTWAYVPASNAWRKLEFGTKEERDLLTEANAAVRAAWSLLSEARGRYFCTETESEAKADLVTQASAVVEAASRLSGETKGKARATQALVDAVAEWKNAAAGLGGKIGCETLLSLSRAHRLTEAAVRALAVEPPSRMDAQMAFDVASKKIVLFGGDGGDRLYADTWVYDCVARKWELRYPQVSPPPRAGAAVLYLPKRGTILLAGGYTSGYMNQKNEPHFSMGHYVPVADLWTYDVAANRWALLWLAESQKDASVTPSSHGVHGITMAWPAAVNPDDVVVMFGANDGAISTTWACKVDAAKVLDAGTYGVSAGTIAMNQSSVLPEEYEKAALPNPAVEEAFLAALPTNRWQQFKCPLSAPCRDWGTTAYDPVRHQLLYWGGGHVTYHLTDVNHFSLRSGLWTSSYTPDWTRLGGFGGLGTVSFGNRPDIPVHAYHFYVYDPKADRMIFANSFNGLTLTYDVANREWEVPVTKNPWGPVRFNEVVASTPYGAMAWARCKLWLWDGQARAWSERLLKKKLPEPYSDRSGMCYDSRRDCLWISDGDTSPLVRYEFKTGECVECPGVPKSALPTGNRFNTREMVYVNDQDLVFVAGCGNALTRDAKPATAELVFDPQSGKWNWANIANPTMVHGWQTGLAYDPFYKVLLNCDGGNVSVLKFDRRTAGLEEIRE